MAALARRLKHVIQIAVGAFVTLAVCTGAFLTGYAGPDPADAVKPTPWHAPSGSYSSPAGVGTWVSGVDIPAGPWAYNHQGPNPCKWEVHNPAGHLLDFDTVEPPGAGTITLPVGWTLTVTRDCGVWRWVG